MNLPITAPYNCRPLKYLINIPRAEWTQDEKSAFCKMKNEVMYDFIAEWENICNQLNPHRKVN